jgi:hypothetical protein
MILIKGLVLGIFLACSYLPAANAYLDPGTGSIILQSVFAALAAVVVFFGFIKNSILSFIKKVFRVRRD